MLHTPHTHLASRHRNARETRPEKRGPRNAARETRPGPARPRCARLTRPGRPGPARLQPAGCGSRYPAGARLTRPGPCAGIRGVAGPRAPLRLLRRTVARARSRLPRRTGPSPQRHGARAGRTAAVAPAARGGLPAGQRRGAAAACLTALVKRAGLGHVTWSRCRADHGRALLGLPDKDSPFRVTSPSRHSESVQAK
jgi:hypothetical protein